MRFFKAQEYSKAFKAKIESFVKDTIKLALRNFGTPGGTALPFIYSLHQRRKALHGYSRKSCEAGEFQTRHIKVFNLKYQEYWCYYEEHVEEAQRIFPNVSSRWLFFV
ncbi:UNVERIFIED_CONTAM: hypothetical protein Sangu_3048600 [Sesamum angustifolium]|uniref:Uncharacterized protein n=1 Tax=Sesamum angustifolium TaxID=2727405 RepID=A0AAW2KE10_9LAMI